jgi:hypothetical protein
MTAVIPRAVMASRIAVLPIPVVMMAVFLEVIIVNHDRSLPLIMPRGIVGIISRWWRRKTMVINHSTMIEVTQRIYSSHDRRPDQHSLYETSIMR